MKTFFQGLLAFELLMLVATFVAHMISKVMGDIKVSVIKIYLIVAVITLISYLLLIAITFLPLTQWGINERL